jgi:superfamily I DNA/RNA helicase
LLKEDGLIIFGVDETQRIYEGTDWKWIDVGFDARGKTTILKKSYRNPGKILKLALEFLKKDRVLMEELRELEAVVTVDGIESVREDDGEIEFYETDNEFEKVAHIVSNLLKQKTKPEEIFILTPHINLVKKFHKTISSLIPEIRYKLHHFSSNSEKGQKFIPKDKLVIMPYKSAKGLERPVVIVTGVQALPYSSSKKVSDKRRDRRTLYVALTRAQRKLIITSYLKQESEFSRDLKEVVENIL